MENPSTNTDSKLVHFLKKTSNSPSKREATSSLAPRLRGFSATPVTLHDDDPFGSKLKAEMSSSQQKKNIFIPTSHKTKQIGNKYMYRSLEEDQKVVDSGVSTSHEGINRIAIVIEQGESKDKSLVERKQPFELKRQAVTSLGNKEDSFRISTRKLYQISFKNSKISQNLRGGVVSHLKIPNYIQEDQQVTSTNFSTYSQFQSYVNRLIDPHQTANPKLQPAQPAGEARQGNEKKCSIIPALRPNCNYKQKKAPTSQKSTSNLASLHQYVLSRRAEKEGLRQLRVESKKHELVQNYIMIKIKMEREKRKRPAKGNEQEQTNSIGENEIASPSKIDLSNQGNRDKRVKNIPYFMSSSLEKSVYEQKIASYRQLLFIVNFAHRIYNPLTIVEGTTLSKQEKNSINRYYYFVGQGNNAMLIRSLMKRRIWWSETTKIGEAQFVWTQLKVPDIIEGQPKHQEDDNQLVKQYQQGDQKDQATNIEEDQSGGSKNSISNKKSADCVLTIQQCSIHRNLLTNHQKTQAYAFPKGLMFKAPFAVHHDRKLLTTAQSNIYNAMLSKIPVAQAQQFDYRLKYLPRTYLQRHTHQQPKVHNHFQFNHSLGNKKALLHHMQLYYKLTNSRLDKAFPLTLHIRQGLGDPNYVLFQEQYKRISRECPWLKNIWILKPGQNSNRGNGIMVLKDIKQIRRKINSKQKHFNGEYKTFILQKYIERPLLYKERKFDIRHYMIITRLHGKLRAYFYGEGYVRTSSFLFSLENIRDPAIHLTNDAVQKQCEDYGVFQEGNKVSYNDLQKYFTKVLPNKNFNMLDIYVRMRQLAKDALCSTYISLDPYRRLHNFEVFGLDFMIDEQLKVYLIEVNTNPCLQLSSSLLTRIIPSMIDQTFRLALDPLFPPPMHYTNNTRYMAPDCNLDKIQFELIFSEERQGVQLRKLYDDSHEEYTNMLQSLKVSQFQEDEVFEDEGEEIEIDKLI